MPDPRRLFGRFWPWLVLLAAVVPAVWSVLEFETDIDPEFPQVARATYSQRPPAAYRLAEPGDTIDRVSLYAASAGVVLALLGWTRRERRSLWPAALVLMLAAWYHAATPGPNPAGWHGLGWRILGDATAPGGWRVVLGLLALGMTASFAAVMVLAWPERRALVMQARESHTLGLLVIAGLLVLARQVEIPGAEPAGYWPRWAFAWGLIAFDLALVRLCRVGSAHHPGMKTVGRVHPTRIVGWGLALAAGWLGLTYGGIALVKWHRPIARFKQVVPGRIFISAMPSHHGLELVQRRHHFKTIMDLFPEDTPLQSSLWPEELRFVKEHPEIRFVRSPADPSQADAFLDETLRLAQDPSAWPILVHCHACMDRTPAWLGLYRFAIEGRPLVEVLREIEQHRGCRPKASVTLLYNHTLPRLAPERAQADATARELKRNAAGSVDPYALSHANLTHLADETGGRRDPS